MSDLTKLTPAQIAALEKMKETFLSHGIEGCGLELSDRTFLRYLRARSFDFAKASAMLHETINWRHEFGLSNIHSPEWQTIVASENATGKMYVRGFDKGGSVILYMKPKFENTSDHDGNLKHLVYNMEKAVACMDAHSGQEKLSLIIDYDGYSLSNAPPMKTSKQVLHILQNHYPERLNHAYLIHPPWIFNAFWAVIHPFIDPITRGKISMLKSDAKIKEDLSSHIDPAVLECCFFGQDDRPFDSNLYLSGDFDKDFHTQLREA